MCRIAAIVDFNKNSNYDVDTVINQMRDAMAAGGPDDAGSWSYKNEDCRIGFGHRRLSIIDTSSAGHQPMHSHDDRLTICYNGEMYNYREVKNELITKGYTFRTHSDTEVILQAYVEWGISCISRFTGMFAFYLLDKKNNEFYVVRDRAGVKPVYYYQQDDLFLFGSELKAFHQHPEFRKSVNKDALAQFLKFGYIPAPHCIFDNTYKLLPGHYLKINLHTKESADHAYWNVIDTYKAELNKNISTEDLINETEKILTVACNYRMVADVPVGVFLSGGYDSSAVTALIQKERTEKLKTFCIGFEEEQFNEAPFAKKVADYLQTDHTEYICTQSDALKIIPKLPEIYDEPFGDSSAIPTVLVSRIARESVTVALSADAGDEVFGGYEKYSSVINLEGKLEKYPNSMKGAAGKLISALNPEFLFASSAGNTISKRASKFSKILQSDNMGETLHWLSTNYTKAQLQHIMGAPVNELRTNFYEAASFDKGADNINTMLAIDYMTYLPDDILTKVDRATMSVSLEGREPLLDHKLLEWMATIPGQTKFRNNTKKYILKEIVHRHIPKEIMDRKKMGFGVPVALWFKKELREYFDHYFSDENLDRHRLFNKKYIQQKKDLFYKGNDTVIAELWYFLMFQLWYERWM